MSYSTGLKYKPILSGNIADILDKVGLVHMFEFSSCSRQLGDPARVEGGSFLGNLVSAVAGKSTGLCSVYQNRDLYNQEKGLFECLATSTVKREHPFKLFGLSNVGLLVNPEKVKFVFISFEDIDSHIFGEKVYLKDKPENSLINTLNLGEKGYKNAENNIVVPIQRTEAEEENLSKVFFGEFMGKYENQKDKKVSDDFFGFNEIGVTFPPEAIEAVIVHSSAYGNLKDFNLGYAAGRGDHQYNEISGVMLANLFAESVQQKGGAQLPILHYNLKLSGKTNFNEVEIESRKVVNVLKNDPVTRDIYEFNLGQQYVQNIMLGKTAMVLGGKG